MSLRRPLSMTVVRVESVAGGSTPSDRPTPRGQPLIRGGYNFDSTAVRLIFTVSEINGNFKQQKFSHPVYLTPAQGVSLELRITGWRQKLWGYHAMPK